MPRPRWLIVIGASAGGVQAVRDLCRGLPPRLPAAVCVVIHTPADGSGRLGAILQRETKLKTRLAQDGDILQSSHIYVGPPNHHVTIDDDRIRLGNGPKEHGFRPAIDPLFRTAAVSFGPSVIGVVLSGGLSDGASGLAEIKRHGGIAIVQHPDDAEMPSMPEQAIRRVPVDEVLNVDQIAQAIVTRVMRRGSSSADRDAAASLTTTPARDRAIVGGDGLVPEGRPGLLTEYTCPDCGGTLRERTDDGMHRYECHVGHSYSQDSLLTRQRDQLEDALWTALRTLEEAADLRRRVGDQAERRGLAHAARAWRAHQRDLETRATTVREALRLDVISRPDRPLEELTRHTHDAQTAQATEPATRSRRKIQARAERGDPRSGRRSDRRSGRRTGGR